MSENSAANNAITKIFRNSKMEWLKAIIILPFNVLVIIPAFILYLCKYKYTFNSFAAVIIGILLLICGISLAVWTMVLFNNIGKGTAAPWAPPKHLVIAGPYKYIRNPMITAVLTILAAEGLLLNSLEIFCWFLVFLVINMIYFPLSEEKQLVKRFGQEYLNYMEKVPRWLQGINLIKKYFK